MCVCGGGELVGIRIAWRSGEFSGAFFIVVEMLTGAKNTNSATVNNDW